MAKSKSKETWRNKAGLYVRAIDFLRDNRDLFAVADYWDTIERAITYCDHSGLTWPVDLSKNFYQDLLPKSVYTAGPLTATFIHKSGSEYHVPGRTAGETDFAPSGQDVLHYALDRVDAAITELGAAQDHRLVHTIQDRYRIIETLRAGLVPISSEIEALRGYVGGDPKPKLKKLIKKNNISGLKSYVGRQKFLDSLVYTRLITVLSSNRHVIKSGGSGFLYDPAQITDLAYLAAVNGVILRKAFEIAADVASQKGISLSSVWGDSTYQSSINSFIKDYMQLVRANRTKGAVALSATI